MLIRRALVALVPFVALCAILPSFAQTYPNRPIRLVVNFPGGGNVDNIVRLMTPQLESQMGANFVIDNRAGANGIIGAEIVAKAPPDGYTLLFSPSSVAVNQVTYSKLPYDVLKDFAPITNACAGSGYLLVVHPSVPAKTVKELIALNKAKPLAYGTPGQGNPQHFIGEFFNLRTGTQMVHVPYKGVTQQLIGVLSGEVAVVFAPPLAVTQHVASGKLRAIAFTGATRWSSMPELPTISESGVRDFVWRTGWQGWFAPARTAPEIVTRLNAEIRRALENPKVRETLASGGYDVIADSPAEFRAFIQSELKRYAEIARKANIRFD
jgi:tripartite-type tricarboxylate transporter receptor subunit TctC